MRTYTNTKEIPAKLLYDLLKKTFNEFYADATKKREEFGFGLGEDVIAIEKADGTPLYSIEVSKDVIALVPINDAGKSVNEQLERFVESCLL